MQEDGNLPKPRSTSMFVGTGSNSQGHLPAPLPSKSAGIRAGGVVGDPLTICSQLPHLLCRVANKTNQTFSSPRPPQPRDVLLACNTRPSALAALFRGWRSAAASTAASTAVSPVACGVFARNKSKKQTPPPEIPGKNPKSSFGSWRELRGKPPFFYSVSPKRSQRTRSIGDYTSVLDGKRWFGEPRTRVGRRRVCPKFTSDSFQRFQKATPGPVSPASWRDSPGPCSISAGAKNTQTTSCALNKEQLGTFQN